MLKISKENLKKLILLSLFAAAFGYLEASVVVYLRELYYPFEFDIPLDLDFPYIFFGFISYLQPIPLKILIVEIGREAATIIMLSSLALLSAKTYKKRWGFFLWTFALWDIFYYMFLKYILGWPESLSTLDVLFLIPVPWIAPVWMPLLGCVFFITTALVLLKEKKKISKTE
jgi:hypothetical protein